MTQKEVTETVLTGNKHEKPCIRQISKKTPPRRELRITAVSFDQNDFSMMAKIKSILAKGNNAEVKGGKNGPLVMEVRKTII